MTLSRLHEAHLQPREPRLCAPGEHEPDGRTLTVSDEDKPNCIVSVECARCGLTGWYEPLPGDWYDWGEQ